MPSGENAKEEIRPSCPPSSAISFQYIASQIFTASPLPEMKVFPSGAKMVAITGATCPLRSATKVPAFRLQTRREPSSQPTARRSPAGAKATVLIQSWKPLIICTELSSTFQSLTEQSQLPDASSVPSGENAKTYGRARWPLNVRTTCRFHGSQSLIVLSMEVEASNFPSGEIAIR